MAGEKMYGDQWWFIQRGGRWKSKIKREKLGRSRKEDTYSFLKGGSTIYSETLERFSTISDAMHASTAPEDTKVESKGRRDREISLRQDSVPDGKGSFFVETVGGGEGERSEKAVRGDGTVPPVRLKCWAM